MNCFNEYLSGEVDKDKDSEPFSRLLINLWKHHFYYFLRSVRKWLELEGTTKFLKNY